VADCNGLLVLREDLKTLQAKPGNLHSVHLLPYFDVYLLGHSVKDHLLDQRLYKRVYRNQAWITPVVLLDGRIAGVWSSELSRQAIHIKIELFSRASRELRKQIEARARELADFFQKTPAISFLS